jgi:hypothetical protein
MNGVDLLLTARAAESGRAQPRRLRRHLHLETKPIAIAAVQMSIESHAIWGALVGTSRSNPQLIVAPEPRTPGIAFDALAELATIVCDAVNTCAAGQRDVFTSPRTHRSWTRLRSAPQLLVANEAVVALLNRLGRRMRPAGYGGHIQVPPEVNIAGAHLAFFAEQAARAGSSLTVVATRELAAHFATGQSSFENAHLGTQLAWHDPNYLAELAPALVSDIDLDTLHGTDAASLIEQVPMSILTDPTVDNGPLIEAVARFNTKRAGSVDSKVVERHGKELRDLLRPCLEPTWEALWIARDILLALPEAPSVQARWEDDLQTFTRHTDYIARGGRIASVDSARRAALVHADWEGARARFEAAQVLEDELALLAAISEGKAIAGQVTDVDSDNSEMGPSGKRRTSRPLITLALDEPCPFPVGTELWWTERQDVCAHVQTAVPSTSGGATVVLKVVAGMRGKLPEYGSRACFSIFHANDSGFTLSAPLPKSTPWTHTPSAGSRGDDSAEIDDGPALDTLVDVTSTLTEETVAI